MILRCFAGPVWDWRAADEMRIMVGGIQQASEPQQLMLHLLWPSVILSIVAAVFLLLPSVGEAFAKVPKELEPDDDAVDS